MRSSTRSDLPGRCPRCWVRLALCICAEVPTVRPTTRLTVIRHEREAQKSTGTARIAQLALPELELLDFGDDPHEANARLDGLEGAHLLFPSEPAAPWAAPIGRLVILDGTWRQARRMLKKLPALQALPRLWLPEKHAPVLRLRGSVFEQGRSTLEAIADALRLLEGDAVAQPLDALHEAYVERVFRARGVWAEKVRAFSG